MKILFYTETLNYRGTTVATLDYAKYVQNFLGHEVIIGYDSSLSIGSDIDTVDKVLNEVGKNYETRAADLNNIDSITNGIDFAYFIRAGNRKALPKNVPSGVHAVFRYNEPHGNVYAYVSKWLSNYMTSGKAPYVPHIVYLPQPTENYRKYFGIPSDALVIGRYGGYDTFDLAWVKEIIKKILEARNDIYFLFMNTRPFFGHNNIIYVSPVHDLQIKSNYINTCDAFIHARQGGESFGLSVCEPLFFNKPVLASYSGGDKNHISILADTPLLYDESNLYEKILSLRDFNDDWTALVSDYSPIKCIEKFEKVFLKY